MPVVFSPIADTETASIGNHFSALRLELDALSGFSSPIMGFDHYRMSGPTFAPHPHAGFSAVSYVFEDSPGALRNRDSLGNDILIEPGDVVWTQAGSGIIHDEFPADSDLEVHGLQLFVNLNHEHKKLAPIMIHATASSAPVVRSAGGNQVRVLSGKFGTATGPIEPVEPFDFLDVKLNEDWNCAVQKGKNLFIYVISGSIKVSSGLDERSLSAHQAIAIQSEDNDESVLITSPQDAQLLVLCGADIKEPIVTYGPFIMNTQSEIKSAYLRYMNGQMGHLPPIG